MRILKDELRGHMYTDVKVSIFDSEPYRNSFVKLFFILSGTSFDNLTK